MTCPGTSFPANEVVSIVCFALLLICAGAAQNYVAPSNPQIGSANTVTANASVPRPSTTPCTVQLFQNLDFSDFNPKYFNYTPPSGCPGPWAAVVLEADWSVDAGRQFDRTAEIWIGGARVYFGTTAEPSHNVQRMWHTENNLTDYSPLFTIAQDGRVDLGNLVNGMPPAICMARPCFSSIPSPTASRRRQPLTWCCRCRAAPRVAR